VNGLNNEGATVTPPTTANEEDTTTLSNEEATVTPAATANEQDITLTGATIEEVGITTNKITTATQTQAAVNEEDINVSNTTNAEATDEIPYGLHAIS
jgi:hypothetical protein